MRMTKRLLVPIMKKMQIWPVGAIILSMPTYKYTIAYKMNHAK